ncbi:MAG: helix-turn-helix transcriptional regulator [Azospirillaceae bacterium]|nr:helix-turn-helix transcriptional regulator [Azospirillaceae bacterium]
MLFTDFTSPADTCKAIAARAREARLAANLSQEGLAERAGVSLGSLKRFERLGAGSLDLVVRVAIALRQEAAFEDLFKPPKFTSLDAMIAQPQRRARGTNK